MLNKCVALGLGLVLFAQAQFGVAKPNILLIMVDDMGWADLGCYGQQAYDTPNLDQLAAEGIRFNQAYSGCTVCAPARCALMTGLHLGHAAVRGNSGGIPLPDAEVTIAEMLKDEGYTCGGFGKWGLGDLHSEGAPERQGYDLFYGYYHQVHAHNYYPAYLIRNSQKEKLKKKQYSHYLIVEETKKFIRDNRTKPFFCYAAWTPPHASYQIPSNDPAWQAVKDKPWPKQARGHAAFNLMLDRNVGELMALLKELDIDDNTVVFFCSDHGASGRFEGTLNSSGALTGFKRSMHEGGLRVPFIARWPNRIPAGTVSELQTYFPDMMPTIAELVGGEVSVPDEIDGISIAPTLLGEHERQVKHEYIYWEWPKIGRGKAQYDVLWQAARHGQWKLLRHDHQKPWQLYNLSNDLTETDDLAQEHPEVVQRIASWITENRTEMAPQVEPKYPKGKRFQ